MRAFVGVDAPAPLLPGLPPPKEGAPSHLTLLFFADLPAARSSAFQERARALVADHPGFRLELAGIDAFPDRSRPRIVYAEVTAGRAELVELHRRLVEAARGAGLSFDGRAFVPHLTLRRVRTPNDAAVVRSWLELPPGHPLGSAGVAELLLKSSELGAGGPTHRIEARLPLAPPAPP